MTGSLSDPELPPVPEPVPGLWGVLMKSDTWNVVHYGVAGGLLALYGGAVCPLIENLSLVQLIAPIAVAFATGLILRAVARQVLLGDRMVHTRPRRVAAIEWITLMSVGFSIAAYNHVVYQFPLQSHSGLKVLLGTAAIGVFIAMDALLTEELSVGRWCKRKGINVQIDAARQSFSRRLFVMSFVCVLVVATVLVLLINKQLLYLSWRQSLAEVSEVKSAILFECIFVVAIMTGYIYKVMTSSSRVLAFYLGNQKDTLERVSGGDYADAVPVVSNDEFGDIARHTNAMIQTIAARSAELQRTQDATILSLASLAETRDNETGAHIMRTQHYVKVLADHLATRPAFRDQLQPDVIELITKSTPLHDIGKVGIPDSVLLKPGKLTDDEYAVMKTHTLLGVQALEVVETELGESHFLSFAKDVVATHHERWDGKGYPAGLAGLDIPLCGRLMAVADVYDALISKRVYKPAMSHADARAIILDGRGSQFDPDVVDAFVACEEAFREVACRYGDGPFTEQAAV